MLWETQVIEPISDEPEDAVEPGEPGEVEAPEEGGVVRVKELLAEDADTETALLRAAATRHGATQLRIRRPPQPDRPSQPYGLAARLDDRLSAADIDRLHMALMLD